MIAQAIRRRLLKPPFAPQVDLSGKHYVVTGCSPGSLGFATASILLRSGASVVTSTRSGDVGLIAELAIASGATPDRISCFALDLCEPDSVRQFIEQVRQRIPNGPDALINNAGIHLDLMSKWKEPQLTKDGFELHWRTNYLGTLQLTHGLLDDLLKRADQTGDARVVNVVSMLHSRGSNDQLETGAQPYNSWVAYGCSKLALMHFTHELQRRFEQRGLQAYCLHPGAVNTPVGVKGMATSPVIQTLVKAMVPLQSLFMLSPEEGAQTQVMCATEAGLKGGQYFRDCAVAKASDDSQNAAVAETLWHQGIDWLESSVNTRLEHR